MLQSLNKLFLNQSGKNENQTKNIGKTLIFMLFQLIFSPKVNKVPFGSIKENSLIPQGFVSRLPLG